MSKRVLSAIFISVFIILALSRFIFLDKFPPGMLHDEMEYALSSKTYSLTGADLSGVHFPQSLFKTNTLGQISPIPALILSPIWKVIPINLTTYKFAYVLLNILTALVMIGLSFQLFKNKSVAYLSGIMFLLNPWSFFLSRFGIDAAFSLFFYLLGTLTLLKFSRWKLILSLLCFALGFFSYNGAKLLLIPIVVISVGYRIWKSHRDKNEVIDGTAFVAVVFILLVLFTGISLRMNNSVLSSRSNEIILLDKNGVSREVNLERNQSMDVPLKSIFLNKATIPARLFIENYLGAFSPQSWFSFGDYVNIQSFEYHGFFYLFDGVIIALGIFHLLKSKKKEAFLLIALGIVSPFPTAVSQNGESLVNRSFFLLPMVILFAAWGLYVIFHWLKKKYSSSIAVSLLSIILTFTYINFLFIYFFQLPVFGQENFLTSERVLAKYLLLESKTNKNIVVVDKDPRQIYLATLFYGPSGMQNTVLKKEPVGFINQYALKNIQYVHECPKTFDPKKEYIINYVLEKCVVSKLSRYIIVNERDAGIIYRLYNAHLCDGVSLSRWRDRHLISDYAIEKMDTQTFCQRWIAQPTIHDAILHN